MVKAATLLGKLYLLPKIHNNLFCFPGLLVISNFGAPTEKVSRFSDVHLKFIMQNGESYIKYLDDLLLELDKRK